MSHEKSCEILKDMADKGWLDTYVVEQIDACFGTGHISNSVWIKECYRDGIQ